MSRLVQACVERSDEHPLRAELVPPRTSKGFDLVFLVSSCNCIALWNYKTQARAIFRSAQCPRKYEENPPGELIRGDSLRNEVSTSYYHGHLSGKLVPRWTFWVVASVTSCQRLVLSRTLCGKDRISMDIKLKCVERHDIAATLPPRIASGLK